MAFLPSRFGLLLVSLLLPSACKIISDKADDKSRSELTAQTSNSTPPRESISSPKTATAAAAPSVEPGSHQFWVDPNQDAARDAKLIQDSQPADAKILAMLAAQPTAVWFGEWNKDVMGDAKRYSEAALSQGRYLLLVVYAIPHRDCSNYSAGGLDPLHYREWIKQLATGLGQVPAYIIIEPDAIVLTDCLKEADRLQRFELIKEAVIELKKNPNARLYIDVGHPAWLTVDEASQRLLQAGIEFADGFALNIANYQRDEDCIRYGQDIRGRVGGKGFVIDSSRNGKGPLSKELWCNPMDRAVGRFPLAPTGLAGLDAYLWIKKPGESDGTCNGGPAAGQWWRSRAIELMRNAGIKP